VGGQLGLFLAQLVAFSGPSFRRHRPRSPLCPILSTNVRESKWNLLKAHAPTRRVWPSWGPSLPSTRAWRPKWSPRVAREANLYQSTKTAGWLAGSLACQAACRQCNRIKPTWPTDPATCLAAFPLNQSAASCPAYIWLLFEGHSFRLLLSCFGCPTSWLAGSPNECHPQRASALCLLSARLARLDQLT